MYARPPVTMQTRILLPRNLSKGTTAEKTAAVGLARSELQGLFFIAVHWTLDVVLPGRARGPSPGVATPEALI